MNNGPLPTRLIFLSDLATQPHGTKVRFLGCVTRYNLSTGVLELQHTHHHPPPTKTSTVALVDVNVVLEGLKREDTQVGAWINVVGYVEEVLREGSRRGQRQRQGQGQEKTVLATGKGEEVGEGSRMVRVRVQAIMLWNAGGVKIGGYERTLEERLELEKGSRRGNA